MQADELLRQGRLEDSLEQLKQQVRKQPADAKLRVFLFQLLSVLGRWDGAMAQLNVAAELDDASLLLAQVYRTALQCEALRTEVFAGRRTPVVFGQPPGWVALLMQAGQLLAEGRYEAAEQLRGQAFEEAPAVAGTLNGEPFQWVADADMRLGPVLEAVVEGRYYWVPFENIRSIHIEPPTDLRDMVWAPAVFTLANGGETGALIPTRYPGSESSEDAAILLARKTEWCEPHEGLYLGLGQRLLATDHADYPLLETRQIVLVPLDPGEPVEGEQDGRADAHGASPAVPAGPPEG